MGHRSYLRHHPRTLPGAPRDARRRLGRGDKKKKKKKGIGACSSRTTRYVIILHEVRLPGGSIGAALGSIVLLLDGSTVVGPPRPTAVSEFDESRQRSAGPIDRSPRRSTTTTLVFGTKQTADLTANESVGSETRDHRPPRAAGIPRQRVSELIRGFVARLLEQGPGAASDTPTAGVERSSGSINELIPSDIAGLLGEPSIRFVKSIRRKVDRIERFAAAVVDLKERRLIIGRPTAYYRRLSSARLITRVGRVDRSSAHTALILPRESDKPASQFSQLAICGEIRLPERSRFSSKSRGPSTRVTVPFRAAAMSSGRRTSFR